MLVSSIARLSAANSMNSASFASMEVMNSMQSALNNQHNLGIRYDLLNNLDKKNCFDLLTNGLLYKVSDLQEKHAAKRLNVLA